MANPPPRVPSLEQQRFIDTQSLKPHRRPSGTSLNYSGSGSMVGGARPKRTRRQFQQKTTDAIVALSSNASWRAPVDGPTPRKTAYSLQKEQRHELDKQARELEERVNRLRFRLGLPTKTDREATADTRRRNWELDEKIHDNRRYVVALQSLLTDELQLPAVNPLSTYIHLPCDQAQRRAILSDMKDVKLRRAAEIGIARFRHLEANASYLCEERFTTDDGAFHCNRWEMNAFPNFQTTRQMFDALVFWVYNMEISVTEMANQVALREDRGEYIGPTIWNQRIVTTTADVGCIEELNMANFAHFYDSYDLLDGAPLGVLITDTVDEDDLYPYKPLERTRKDVQAYHLFSEVIDLETQQKSVVLKTCVLNTQLPPQFPVEQRVIDKLHEHMSGWVVVMKQYLREYTVPPVETLCPKAPERSG